MKRSILFLLVYLSFGFVQADLLDDISMGKYRAINAPMMTFAEDDEHYYQLSGDSMIVKYSLRNGNPTDTVFHVGDTKLSKIERVGGFELGPRERFLMLYTNREQVYRHSYLAEHYLYDIHRKELRRLSDQRERAVLFSPDSRYIAFAAEDNNLYVYKTDFHSVVAVTKDGEARKIINGTPDWLYEEEFGTRMMFDWSADSKQLAFVRFDESEVKMFDFQMFLNPDFSSSPMELYPSSFTYKYPKAGEVNAHVSVCVYDTYYMNVKTMDLDTKNCYVPRIKWTGVSDQLAIFRLNRNQNKLEMFYANSKSTVCKNIYTEEDKRYVDFMQIDEWRWLSDGSMVVVNEIDGYRHLHLYDKTGLHKKLLTQGNWDVTALYGVDEKSQTAYVQTADEHPARRNLYSVSLRTGKKTLLSSDKGTHQAAFSPKLKYYVDTYSSTEKATCVTLCENSGKKVRVLHDNASVESSWKALNLPRKEFIELTTDEGVHLYGWIVKPQHMEEGKQYPLLQVQYSGPNSQQVLDRWKIDWEYALAAEGYIVACVDGRGTGARGSEFRKCTYRKIGQLEVADQLGAARYFGSLPYVDSERMAIWGWSFGGYMTLMCLSADKPVFKAGIAVAPVSDWRLYNTAYTERYMRRPQENFSGYDSGSPLMRADKLEGNLLLVHGTADDNVHVQNAYLYVHRLVEAGKQFEMQIYPDENHFIRKGNSYRHLYQRMKLFLDKNL